MFYVYCIFNTINGKVYVGKTNNLHRRWLDHKRTAKGGKEKYKDYNPIHAAINKYGVGNFDFLKIQEFEIEANAYAAEEYWIKFYNSRNSQFGYNITVGGIGSGSGKDSPNFGLKRSEATLEKLRETHLGDKNSNYGKEFSQETLSKMSSSQKGKQLGEKHANSILTWDIVDEIRKLHDSGTSLNELSKQFNTHRTNVYSIVKYKTWIKR